VDRGELDIPSAIEIGVQVADALASAHEQGIVHRDIKSDNIMVTKDGHPKILDFGLAKLLDVRPDGDADATRIDTMAMTQAGIVMGTVAYMSPEQARGLPADQRSDMFSFGVVLYEMASGKLPFRGASALDTMHAIAFQQTAPITTIRAGLPYSLQRTVERCLEKKPEDRYPGMRDVVLALRTVRRELDSGVSGKQPLVDRARLWARNFTARGGLVVGLAGFAVGVLMMALFSGKRGLNLGSVMIFGVIGLALYRRIRNRRVSAVAKFAKRASKLPEVRLVTSNGNSITVIVERPTAKTYVKLNSFLTSANSGLFQGEPFTLAVRENLSAEERTSMLSSPGLHYAAD